MPQSDATVIATYSRRMRLRLADGHEVDARIKGKRLKPVCGDRVTAEAIDNETDWLIASIAPRRNELTRPDRRGRTDVLAANIDCLVAVAAAEPKPDWYIIDRYLCAAELMGIVGVVVYNKIDLDTSPTSTADELANYQRIGHDVAQCSANDGRGIAEVETLIGNRCTIIVGQSGVGKSSIINRLSSGAQQRVVNDF